MSSTGRSSDSSARGRLRFALASSVVDQGISSAISIALTVTTGRRLGAAGLGSVALALAVYLVALAFQRALVLDPLSVQSDRGGERPALLASCAVGVAATVAMYVLGIALGDEAGAALVAFAPWAVPALLVDAVRVAGFRSGKSTAGVTAGVAWLLVMLGGLFVTARGFGVADVASSWGAGATAGALAGCIRLRCAPSSPRAAWTWWQSAWTLGRWLALQTAAYTTGMQGAQFALGVVAGPAALGTLKAVQTLFAPLTLLLPAMNTPALPAVARALRTSQDAARSLARRLSLALSTACGVYLLVALWAREPVATLVFGRSFELPIAVLLPVALGQLVIAAASGTFLLLRAAEDGRGVFVATAASAGLVLLSVLAFGRTYGATAAAWGIAVGAVAATAAARSFIASALKDKSPSPVRVRMAPTP